MEQCCPDEENPGVVSRCGRGTPQRRRGPANGDFPAKSRMGSGTCPVSGAYRPPGRFAPADRDPHSGTIQHAAAKWLDAGSDAVVARAAGDDLGVSRTAGKTAGEVFPDERSGPVGDSDSP